jgi:hypothetical protein
VQNVACIAVPDADLGERMCACVIARPGAALALPELVAYLSKKEIAKFKLPERLEIMDDFPLSTFGKVSKKALVETVSKKMASEPKPAPQAAVPRPYGSARELGERAWRVVATAGRLALQTLRRRKAS